MRNGREAFDKSMLAKYTASGLRLFPRRRFVANRTRVLRQLEFRSKLLVGDSPHPLDVSCQKRRATQREQRVAVLDCRDARIVA